MKTYTCECGRKALFARYIKLDRHLHCIRRARQDHPLCARCFHSLTQSVRAQGLSRPTVPEPKDARQLQAGRLLANLAAIEQLGFDLGGLKDVRASLWTLLRGK
jgi:hypothetical protein